MKRLLKIKSSTVQAVLLRPNNGRWQAIRTDGKTTLFLSTGIDARADAQPACVDGADLVAAWAHKPTAIEVSDDTVMVGSIRLDHAGSPDDYPMIPIPASTLTPVNASDMRTAALSADEGGTIRECLELRDGFIVATDKRRLTAIESPTPPETTLVLASTLALLDKRSAHYGIGQNDTHVTVSDGADYVIHRRYEGRFPDWRRVVAGDYAPVLTVDSTRLAIAIKHAATLTKCRQVCIDDTGRVYGHSTGCTIESTRHAADPIAICFDYNFVVDVCRSIGGPITMSAKTPAYPGIFRDADKRITIAVMPMSDPPDCTECKPLAADTPKPRKTKQAKQTLVEIIPGHVWSSPAMADEVRQALEAWGCMK